MEHVLVVEPGLEIVVIDNKSIARILVRADTATLKANASINQPVTTFELNHDMTTLRQRLASGDNVIICHNNGCIAFTATQMILCGDGYNAIITNMTKQQLLDMLLAVRNS